MKRYILNLLKNMPFKNKISLMTLFSAFIPLLVLTIFSFFLIQHFATEKETRNNLDNLNAAVNQTETKLLTYQDSLNFLINNNQLISGLSLNNPTNFEQYHFYINEVVPLFKTVMYQHSDILKITLYTSLNFYDHGDYVKRIIPGDITNKLTLNQSTDASYYFDNNAQKLYIYNHLFSKKSTDINLVVIQIDAQKLFESLNVLSNDPYELTIINEKNQQMYHFSNEEKKIADDFFTKAIQLINKQSLIHSTTIPTTNWKISFSRPYAQIYKSFVFLIFVTMGVFITAMALLTFFTLRLSKNIVSPLELLAKEMESAPTSNFDLKYYYQSEDEIGKLYKQFKSLLHQTKTLINEVYESEITKKKYELRTLQSQINPHFFYNSLSLINNKAILTGNEEISELALLLSQYYRLTLNGGKHLVTVDKELEMTLTYARIQQKMHHYSFDLETDIDPTIGSFQMINLLIQPFVENAIFHGIDHIDDTRKGKLLITAHALDDDICFTITDNGAGMNSEALLTLFEHSSEHYGLNNVQQRIFLYYGKNNSITCTSTLNEGTTFTIKIPKQIGVQGKDTES
jgi:two-component system sensor histidine kinase YesM